MRPLRALAGLCLALLTACGGEEPAPEVLPGETDLSAGQEAMRAGQYAVAEDLFQRAYVRGGEPHESLLWQVRALVAQGRMEEARHGLIRLLDLVPGHVVARTLQIRLDLFLGELEDAHSHLQLLKKIAADQPATALLDTELLLALGYGGRAEQAATEGEAKHPSQPEWPFHRAKADLVRGWLRAARGGYTAAAQRQQTGRAYAREGYLAALLGEADRAERAYLDAAVHAERDPLPFSLSSDFYAAAGRGAEALTDLAQMERVLGRASPDLTRRVAGLLVRSQRQPDAQALLKPYLQQRVDDRTSARELALSYLFEGKDTEAATTLEVLAAKERDSALTQYLTGAARLRTGDNTRARGAFQDADRLGAERLPVEMALAATALRTGDDFDAEFQARRRLERVPDDWTAGLVWAAARKHQRQIPAARLIQERLVLRFPERADTIRKILNLPPATGPELVPQNLPMKLLDRIFPPPPPPPSAPSSGK